jgi:hypothetical protein
LDASDPRRARPCAGEEAGERSSRHRASHAESLERVTALSPQEALLLRRLHDLGHHGELELVHHGDDRRDHGARLPLSSDLANEGLIDLQSID